MANGKMSTHLQQTKPNQYQKDVDAFFHRRSIYWRDIYQKGENSFFPFYFRERRSIVLEMVNGLGLPVESSILEVGCGAGLTAVALAKHGYVVDAVDHAAAMVDLTRHAAMEAGVDGQVNVTRGNALELNFKSQHFDLALAVGVMPWLDRPVKAMRELNRVLKSGGHVIVTTSNRWCVSRVLDPLRFPTLRSARWKFQDALQSLKFVTRSQPRYYDYSIKEFDEILLQTGFRKVQGFTIGFGPFTLLSYRVIPDTLGLQLHRRLQALADRQFPGIRSGGREHAVLAAKAA